MFPSLTKVNPQVVEALAELSASARSAQLVIDHLTDDAIRTVVEPTHEGLAIDIKALLELPEAVRRTLLGRVVRMASKASAPTRAHILQLEDLAIGRAGRSVRLTSNLVACRQSARIVLSAWLNRQGD